MKAFTFCIVLFITSITYSQDTSHPTLKSILLEQLKTTHNKEEWFVPVNIAISDLTPEQASWKDSSTNHSIAQLVNHLIFWNRGLLADFKGEKKPPFSGDNNETFSGLDKHAWDASIRTIDSVFTAWEQAIETADDTKLKKWYSNIAYMGTHNAYHTGQIIYIRKMRNNWNPEKGVK